MPRPRAEKTVAPAKKTRSRYKNTKFLKALGNYCRQQRVQRGFSIDRLAREAEQLSVASIDRLERGLADSQILVLVRYAEALDLSLIDLFAFLKDSPSFSKDSRIIPFEREIRPPAGYVPVYPTKIAAGLFSDEQAIGSTDPMGWVDAGLRTKSQDYFASFVYGDSMRPLIEDGSLCLFKKYSGGTRQGRIFLIQAQGVKNSETGESFVLKKYMRQTPPRNSGDEDTPATVHLISENPRFSPIILINLSDEDIQTIAEFIRVL